MSELLSFGLPAIGGGIGYLVSGGKIRPIIVGCAAGFVATMLIFAVFGV